MSDVYPLAVTAAEMGLPTTDNFVKTVTDKAPPEMLGFTTACLGLLLATYLIRSWKS